MDEPVVAPVVEPAVEPVTPAVESVVIPPAEAQFFGTDGVLNEGWQGTLDESLREEKGLLSFKTVGDLAKSFVMTKKMVGANVIAVPTDISTEAEWQEYHKAGGRPETVADYGLKMPEAFPEEYYSQELADSTQELLFKFGGSKKLADALFELNNNHVLSQLKLQAQAKETAKAELKSGLATDWGAAFEQKKHLGDIAMNEAASSMVGGQLIVNEEFKARLVAKAGNDPDIIRAFANLGEKFAEGKPPGFAAIPTPSDLQDQIDTLREDPLYTKGTQPQRMKIANKILELKKKIMPEPVNT